MEKVYEELEEAKAEIERLKQGLNEKETIIKQLSSTNDMLRAYSNEELQKLEEDNKQLLSSLDEANEKDRDKQIKLNALTDEGDSLKALVSLLQKRCSDAEKDAPKEKTWERNDLIEELEIKHKKAEDELKWKIEQFRHLKEAHEKLLDKFNTSRSEWETDKSSLLGEISKLQESFDDAHQMSEGLKSQLDMCKQALDHEETRRKRLESEVSEMRSLIENVSSRDQEEQLETECSTAQTGDDYIASLRHTLRVQEMEYKDLEYKTRKLKAENRELLTSLKELQEAHIPKAPAPQASWAKLRGKLKSLEQTHRECSANLQAKEVEWNTRAQKLTHELNRCSLNLKVKDQEIEDLKKEVESCNSSLTQLKMQNEELSLMLQLMKSEFSEAKSGQGNQDREGGVAQLMEQLEMKSSSLAKAQADLNREREERLAIEKELNKYKDLLEESSDSQLALMEEAADQDRDLSDTLLEAQEVQEALEKATCELIEKMNEKSDLEYEFDMLKYVADRLQMQLEESHTMRKELEASLLAQAEFEDMLRREAEEKEERIRNLEQQIMLIDQEILIGEEGSMDGSRWQMDDDDQLQQDLLAKELEEAILSHIIEEKNYQYLQQISERLGRSSQGGAGTAGENSRIDHGKTRECNEVTEACSAKENVSLRHSFMMKTGESIMEERSPFRVLNLSTGP